MNFISHINIFHPLVNNKDYKKILKVYKLKLNISNYKDHFKKETKLKDQIYTITFTFLTPFFFFGEQELKLKTTKDLFRIHLFC